VVMKKKEARNAMQMLQFIPQAAIMSVLTFLLFTFI
jgi:hypothetical protein